MQKKIEVILTFVCGVLLVAIYGYLESSLYVRPANVPMIDVQGIRLSAVALGLAVIGWSVWMTKESMAPARKQGY